MYINNIIELTKITVYVVSQYIHRRTLICTITVYIIRIFSPTKIPLIKKFLLYPADMNNYHHYDIQRGTYRSLNHGTYSVSS